MSHFIVSARKYRPATFEEVIGQAHVADTLKSALQSEKLAHSFLFCGPRGVGKTTCARILAKVINCENPKDKTEPCNECGSCLSFNDQASFNIIELDAASNNSVDNIRNLTDQVRIPPQQGNYKVFIIDEVHMLSTAAFNAFLKTLEEPPAYAIFILATTEKHKILPTILSRCQIFDFKRIQVSDITIQLNHICKLEGITAEPEALHLIGQKADGAMRDALSIFDKVASSSGSSLTYKSVIANLNILDYEYYFRVVDAFLKEDLSQVLLIMNEVVTQGFDVDQFIQGLAIHFRDLLVCKDQRTLGLLDVSDGLKDRYKSQAQYTTKSMLLTGLDILNQCDIALPRATNKRLYAEIALSKINFVQRTIDTPIVTENGLDLAEKKTKIGSSPSSITPPTLAPKLIPTIVKSTATNTEVQPQKAVEIESSKVAESLTTDTTIEAAEKQEITPEGSAPDNITPLEVKSNPAVASSENIVETTSPTESSPPEIAPVKKEEHKEKSSSENGISNGIDLSLDGMMASIEAEDKALDAAKENFSLEAIQEIWKEYTEQNPSPSVQSALKRTQLTLINDEKLEITVPSAITGDIILNEHELLEKIRTDLGVLSLTYHTKVMPEAFPDYEDNRPKTSLKPREKYQLMLDKKPALKDLIEKLDLKPDNEVVL